MMKDWLNIHLFQAFFQELRRGLGMELDLRQYELLLRALRLGIGADEEGRYSEQAFLSLCKLLWLTHPRYERGFEEAFHLWVGNAKETWKDGPEELEESEELPVPPAGESDSPLSPIVREEPVEPSPEPPPPPQPLPPPAPSAVSQQEWEVSFETIAGETGVPGFAASGPARHRFIFADHYLPFVPRQLQQQCRHLRSRAEKRPGDAIDTEATMLATAEAAGFPRLCYTTERYYPGDFVVFIDRGLGMAAFDKLADIFTQSLCAGLGMSAPAPAFKVYYFNEAPRQLVYLDATLSVSKPWRRAQRALSADSQVFILSDGGAASRRREDKRESRTLEWILEIQQRTEHLLWLNPVPRMRWAGTPAYSIPLLANCLPLTRESMPQLTALLRHL
ncbi:MAG: hypothetical protein J5I94_27255 [Phaeodactylibacter sp.]|nr:hypothetical protein [Phaeodactylibacter sp.]